MCQADGASLRNLGLRKMSCIANLCIAATQKSPLEFDSLLLVSMAWA